MTTGVPFIHTIENAKPSGTLRFAYNHFKLNTLRLGPGTVTLLPPVGRSVLLEHFEINGDPSAMTTVETLNNNKSPTRLLLAPEGTQHIAHARLKNLNASNGSALDATNNCVDLGGNRNIFFENTQIWDGGAPENRGSVMVSVCCKIKARGVSRRNLRRIPSQRRYCSTMKAPEGRL
jgi:hypothetical protein